MALRGVRVLEFTGLAPGPFCGKILADFGATVTRLDKAASSPHIDCLKNGKNTLIVNIKDPKTQVFIKTLCKKYDVLIDPFRPGVLEKNNLGPNVLLKENPRLIYARLTGFGQTGPLKDRAGHDLNYVAMSGVLSFLGRSNEKPTAPINLQADFAGGGLLCALGICMALLERHRSGKGQIVDNSMTEGSAYVASWIFASQNKLPIWPNSRGRNVLDGGFFFYDTYETKDGKFMSVAAIESQFYTEFVRVLGIEDISQFGDNEKAKEIVTEKFLTKTQKEWTDIFEHTDACVHPVLEWKDACEYKHNRAREAFDENGIPRPAPRLSRTPGILPDDKGDTDLYDQAVKVLGDVGMEENEVRKLVDSGIIKISGGNKL